MIILEENFQWHLEAFASELFICHDNSLRDWHGNGYGSVNVIVLGGIDLLHYCCCRASMETCYCKTL